MAGGGLYRVEIVAQLFGVTVRRIQQLTQEGVLPTTETNEGRRYDLVPTIQKYVQYLSDKAYGKSRSEKEAELREQKLAAAGDYISVEEVTLDYSRFFVTFKKFAMSLPARLTGRVSGYVEPLEARHIEKDLTGEVQKLLEAFVVAGVTEPEKAKRKAAAPEVRPAESEGGNEKTEQAPIS